MNMRMMSQSLIPRVQYHQRRRFESARLADRVQLHFFNDGPLSAGPIQNRPATRYDALSREIELAIIAESARWGDARAEIPRTAEDWKGLRDGIVSGYLSRRLKIVVDQLTEAALFSKPPAPLFSRHGGDVPAGFALEVDGSGDVFFTLDGSDPRQRAATVETVTLLSAPSRTAALVPRDGSLANRWTEIDFDDSARNTGETGVGFERSTGFQDLIGIDVEAAMFGVNGSAYLRVPFDVSDPRELDGLELQMKYDDGFVAYLNGVEVARSNAPTMRSGNTEMGAIFRWRRVRHQCVRVGNQVIDKTCGGHG